MDTKLTFSNNFSYNLPPITFISSNLLSNFLTLSVSFNLFVLDLNSGSKSKDCLFVSVILSLLIEFILYFMSSKLDLIVFSIEFIEGLRKLLYIWVSILLANTSNFSSIFLFNSKINIL